MTLQQDGERVSSGDADDTGAGTTEAKTGDEWVGGVDTATGVDADSGTEDDAEPGSAENADAGSAGDIDADAGSAGGTGGADTDAEGDADADEATATGTDGVRTKLQGRELWVQVGALVVASVVLASGLFAWWHAARDAEPTGLGDSRDGALIAARSEIETMNTLDYRKVDEGVESWTSVTTGMLHDQMLQMTPDKLELLADAKKISVGKVLDAAVIDVSATTATVIASIEVTIQDDAVPDSEPTVKRNRLTADLAKVDGEWLLENIQQVGVNLS